MRDPSLIALRPGAVFHGRYRVVRCIKAGGMGAVHEVVDDKTSTRRALKVMLPSLVERADLRARFALEARVCGAIQSEHIVDVIDAGVDEETGAPFLVMELLRGEDLGGIVARRGRLPWAEALAYLHQTALALDKTHAAGVVHRDLKPDNLLITLRDDGSPCTKILDFGIAKLIAQGDGPDATKSVGTPLYMAPEQVHGRAAIGPAADIYALGQITYTLLVGEAYWLLDFTSEALFSFLSRVARGAEEPAGRRAALRGVSLPPAFDEWFSAAAAPLPQDRFAHASEAISALSRALDVPLPRSSFQATERAAEPSAAERATVTSVHGGELDARLGPGTAFDATVMGGGQARGTNGALGKQVLWVDDDRFALLNMSLWLADHGYDVLHAKSPTEAARIVRSNPRAIGCILLDLFLPGPANPMEPAGLRLARGIKKEWPWIPLICVSNVVSTAAVEWFDKHGAGYFNKHELSASTRLFMRTIDEVMTGRKPAPATLLVHGRAAQLLEELRGYLSAELGWSDVRVLREIPSKRRSVVQKLSDEARDVDLVFVLVSPEDATFASDDQLGIRGGQADIAFELGYFLGSSKQRSSHVIVLITGGAALPVPVDDVPVIDASRGLEPVLAQIRFELGPWLA